MYFDRKLCFFDIEITDQKELLNFMSGIMYKNGLVMDSFADAVLAREAEYPTGLEAAHCGIALPHTDSIHVNTSQICFVKLKQPMNFKSMVDIEENIEVEFVFMLAMKEAHEQMENLQNLALMLESLDIVEKLRDVNDEQGFEHILTVANLK